MCSGVPPVAKGVPLDSMPTASTWNALTVFELSLGT
jgi:hypothetical protein